MLFSVLFADDTSVFIEGDTLEDTSQSLNNELQNITEWLLANKLTINLINSHYMVFHRARIFKKRLI